MRSIFIDLNDSSRNCECMQTGRGVASGANSTSMRSWFNWDLISHLPFFLYLLATIPYLKSVNELGVAKESYKLLPPSALRCLLILLLIDLPSILYHAIRYSISQH